MCSYIHTYIHTYIYVYITNDYTNFYIAVVVGARSKGFARSATVCLNSRLAAWIELLLRFDYTDYVITIQITIWLIY